MFVVTGPKAFLAFGFAWFVQCSLLAQSVDPSKHSVRTPYLLDSGSIRQDQFTIESDRENTVVLYVEDTGAQLVRSRRTDGRGLATNFQPIELVSSSVAATRRMNRDSLHVIGDRAFAVWLEEGVSASKARLQFNQFAGGFWGSAQQVDDTTLPANHDIIDFACAVRTGPNGAPYVAIAYWAREGLEGAMSLMLSISVDGGATFRPPIALSGTGLVPGGTAKNVGGLDVDLKGAELHVTWTDDRAAPGGARQVYYRRGIIDWFGGVLFQSPLGTGASDVLLSGGPNVFGAPVIAVDDDPFAAGGYAKYVGVAWREKHTTSNSAQIMVRSSPNSGTSFLAPATVGRTGDLLVNAGEFDLEIVGGDFVVVWQENNYDLGNGTVVLLPSNTFRIWRATSEDGSDFGIGSPAEITMLHSYWGSSSSCRSPVIARTSGFPDGAGIAYAEDVFLGGYVSTSYSDQAYGTEWQLGDFPLVSPEPSLSTIVFLKQVRATYNAYYDNLIVAWQQAVGAESSTLETWIGGYRPPEMEILGWNVGSTALQFRMNHVPVQDSFAFVLLSGGVSADPLTMLSLPDGRRTGLVPDAFYFVGLQNWSIFLMPVDPLTGSAESITLPLPPGLIQPGFALTAAGVTWGPNGSLHVLTDFTRKIP